eukprot:4004151-Prymnesium_polylepis.1
MASSSENGPLKQVFSGYSLSLKDRKSRQLTTTTSSSASTSTASSGAGTPLIPDGLGSSTEDDGSHKLDLILLTVILGLWSLSQIKMAFIWYSKTSKRSSQTGEWGRAPLLASQCPVGRFRGLIAVFSRGRLFPGEHDIGHDIGIIDDAHCKSRAGSERPIFNRRRGGDAVKGHDDGKGGLKRC